MGRRKLSDAVDISTMLKMREDQRMSNREIAEALGTDYSTVLRYIGKQPEGLRKPCERHYQSHYHIRKPETSRTEEVHEACLTVQSRTVKLKGIENTYVINPEYQVIDVANNGRTVFSLNFEDLPVLVKELQAIGRHLADCANKLEMW